MSDTVKDYKKSDQCAAASLLNALISWVNEDHGDTLTISHNQGCYIRDEIERLRKAEQENVALRAKIERLEGPFTYSECEQSHELAKSDFKDGIDELVHCVDNANRYLARRFSIEAARGREGE